MLNLREIQAISTMRYHFIAIRMAQIKRKTEKGKERRKEGGKEGREEGREERRKEGGKNKCEDI
jgi:hypothetical protein